MSKQLLYLGLSWLKIAGVDSENLIFRQKSIALTGAFITVMLYLAISELVLHFNIDNLVDVLEGITVMLQVSELN